MKSVVSVLIALVIIALSVKLSGQDREFGGMEWTADGWVLSTRSIERDEKTWPVIIDSTVDDNDRICTQRFEARGLRPIITTCKTVKELRRWLR